MKAHLVGHILGGQEQLTLGAAAKSRTLWMSAVTESMEPPRVASSRNQGVNSDSSDATARFGGLRCRKAPGRKGLLAAYHPWTRSLDSAKTACLGDGKPGRSLGTRRTHARMKSLRSELEAFATSNLTRTLLEPSLTLRKRARPAQPPHSLPARRSRTGRGRRGP